MDRREVPLGGRDAAGQDLPGAQWSFPSRDAAPGRPASLRPGRLKSAEWRQWRQWMRSGLLTANEPAAAQTDACAGQYLLGMPAAKNQVEILPAIDKALSGQELHGWNVGTEARAALLSYCGRMM